MVILNEDILLEDLELIGRNHLGEYISTIDSNYNKNSFFSVFHLNIRSIIKNMEELLVAIVAYKINCDFIILSECFMLDSINEINIPGYTTFYNNADYNKNDGVIIFAKSNLNVSVKNIKLIICGVTLSILKVTVDGTLFRIIALYRPNPSNLLSFLEEIDNHLDLNSEHAHYQLIVGDINIDILEENVNTNKYLSILAKHGFLPYIQLPTRVTKDTATCLDHIFIKQKHTGNNIEIKTYILTCNITDHYAVIATFLKNPNIQEKDNNESHTHSKINTKKFEELIKKENWVSVISTDDVQVAADVFTKTFKKLMNESIVITTIKKGNKKKLKPWITNGLITSIIRRDKIKRQLNSNYSTELKEQYITYRNSINNLIKKCKHDYYQHIIMLNQNNIKKMYQVITEATNGKAKINNVTLEITNDDDEIFNSNKDMSNFCNHYFSNIGVNMIEKINIPHNFSLDNIPTNNKSIFLTPVTENEVLLHINSLKNAGAPGYDGITPSLLKLSAKYILYPLTHIINLIFTNGQFPKQFKNSVVTPIYKAGNVNKISNYRPISLINNFGKIAEKCIKTRLVEFFKNNNILNEHQYGFQEGKSTSDAMYKVIKEISINLDNSEKCIAVFLDLAKAFDTVNHGKLIQVLERYGIRGTVLGLFKSYLSDRVQYVKINGCLSEPQLVKVGVPQGTVLGPILFTIYINSLLTLDIDSKIISYADDTVAIFKGNDWNIVKEKVKGGIHAIKMWLDGYQLSLNVDKTNYIAFSITNINRPNFQKIDIDKNGTDIKEVEHTKYLGIIIDKNLKWNEHIAYLTKRVRKLIHKFYQLKDLLSKNMLVLVYKSLVESLLRYGLLVWGALYANSLKTLSTVQNYILKIIFKKKRCYPTRLLYGRNISNIRSLYFHTLTTYTYKKEHLKNAVSHKIATRSMTRNLLNVPASNKNVISRFAYCLASKAYNLLPLDIRNIKYYKRFSHQCKIYINDNYLSFIKLLE